MRPELTARQEEVLTCIKKRISKHSWPPSRRELADDLGVQPNTITGHLKSLERMGYIAIEPKVSRGIRVLEEDE